MDYLFSPWRYRYLTTALKTGEGCVLCQHLQSRDDHAALIVYRGRHAAVMLNRYPYTTGHVMILPFQHCARLNECTAEARTEMMELAARAERILEAEYHPDGLNVGLNLGQAAGAGIAGHLHFHVVPRWIGDNNFMTVIGETRVLPEELDRTYARLQPAFAQTVTPPRP